MAGMVYPSNKYMPWPDNKYSLISFFLTSQIFWSLSTRTPLRPAFVSLVFRKKSSTTARFKNGTCHEIVWLSATARVSLSLEWTLRYIIELALETFSSPFGHVAIWVHQNLLVPAIFFYTLCFLQFANRCLLLIEHRKIYFRMAIRTDFDMTCDRVLIWPWHNLVDFLWFLRLAPSFSV